MSLLLAAMLGMPVLLRAWLYVTPNADLTVRGVNVHHLFTGVLLTTLAAIPLALSSSGARMRRAQVACLGTGLGLMLDEWVYLVVTDGSNAAYLLPVSGWGALVLLGLAGVYTMYCGRPTRTRAAVLVAIVAFTSACTGSESPQRPTVRGAVAGTHPDRGAEASEETAPPLWLVAPVGTPSPIAWNSTERDLIEAFGRASVSRAPISLGEQEYITGTILFERDSVRRLEIVWTDSVRRAHPQMLRVLGTRSRWRIAPHISLGSSVSEVERANGRPFTLAGFHWDYAGTSLSWKGGHIDELLSSPDRVIVRFEPTQEATLSNAEARTITGDREIASNDPVLTRAAPRAYALEIWLSPPSTPSRRAQD